MADDVKLTLGIDVEALQRSASAATNMLAQTFEKGISANLLGNGMLPTSMAPPLAGSKDTLGGVIAAIQQVNRTLVVGFNAISGGVYLGGGGGGAGGGVAGGGGGGASGLAPARPGMGVAGGAFGIAGQILSRAGDLAAALMPSTMKMFMGGFYGTDVMGFVHNLVSQIPVAGKLLGAVTGPFHQVMQQNDEFKNMQYEMFRDSGEDSMHAFTNMWTDDNYRDQFINRFGFSRSETQQLIGGAHRRGLGQGQGMETALNMQGALGLGQEATEAMGGLRRAGLKPGQEQEVMANAIGVAVATGLERGRWGEMLTMWQRAAQSSVDTDIAWKEVAAQQQFIGSLGARFKGDTPAAQSMDTALRQMASNAQSPLALRGAMQLTSGDYFGATARMARAAEQPDTDLQEGVINQMMGTSGVQAWLAMPDGPDADRALDRIAGVAATFGTGLSQLKIATLLKARKGTQGALFGGPGSAALSIGGQQVGGAGIVLPDTALGPRRSQSEAQRPSGISSIQGTKALTPGGPGGALQRAKDDRFKRMEAGDPTSYPTMDELVKGDFTFDLPPPAPGSLGAQPLPATSSSPTRPGFSTPPAASYQQFVMQKFGNPIAGRSPHPGVDLAFPPGTALTCPVDAIITHIRDGVGIEDGKAIHFRDDNGQEWKLYHIDPKTFPPGLHVGQRIAKGTPLGRTLSFARWKDTGVRTHLHLGQIGASGVGLDPMRPGGIDPGSLTGGTIPSTSGVSSGGGGGGGGGGSAHVTADVHVYVYNDQAGRPMARVRTTTPVITSSPGQLVGGHR